MKKLLKFSILFVAIGLAAAGCEKEEPDNSVFKSEEIIGKIDLPPSVKPNEVTVSNFVNGSNVDNNGNYSLPNQDFTFAYNKDKQLIYAGLTGNNGNNYTLDAKETAIYFSLLAFGGIVSNLETQADIQAYKELLYSLEEVKILERKILNTVESRGYFEVNEAQSELQSVIEKINSILFSQSNQTKSTSLRSAPITWSPKFYKDFCLDTTAIQGKEDIYDSQNNQWKMTRNLYSGRASIVGVKQAKLKTDNLYEPVGNYIKFTSPYFPKTAGLSVTDNWDMLTEWFAATKEVFTSDLSFWETFAEMKTYSKKTELEFIYKEGVTDGIVLLSGKDDETIRVVNAIYAYFDVVASSIKGLNFDNEEMRTGNQQMEDLFVKFFLSKYAAKIPNMKIMLDNEQWEKLGGEMTGIIEDFLKYFIESMTDKIAEEALSRMAGKLADELDIVFGPYSKVLKIVKMGSKFFSKLLSDQCPSVAIGFKPKAIPTPVPTDGLVAYYPFNGNANDASGKGNNGIVNGAKLTADRHENSNSAYNFNGIDNYIEVQNSDALKNLTDNYSFSIWMTTENGDFQGFSKANCVRGQTHFGLFGHTNSEFRIDNCSSCYSYSNMNSSMFNAEWNHFVAIFSQGQGKLYINNKLMEYDRISQESYGYSVDNPLSIGRDPLYQEIEYHKGKIDDIRIYNRVLTESEVQALYNE
jgi:hypothetical protein